MPTKKISSRSGQTLLIVLLVMTVSLAVGLAVSTRATSTLRQVAYTQQSAQALAFAESGIETALAVSDLSTYLGDHTCGDVDGDGQDNDCTFTVSKSGSSGNFVSFLNRDLVQHVQLSSTSSSGIVYWGASGEDSAAMVITLLYKEGSTYKIVKYAADPNATRRSSNGFAAPSHGSASYGGITYSQGQSFSTPVGGTPVALRLRSMYHSGTISIWVSGPNIPEQGYRIVSTGREGSTTRKVESIVTQPSAPTAFDYILFSGGNLQK